MCTEYRREYAKLHPSREEFGIVGITSYVLDHVSAEIVSPVGISDVRGSGCEIRFESEGREVDECVAGETDLVAMTAETAPAVEDYGTPVGTSPLHIVEEYMITPHCLAETVDAVVHEFLLPVEPPEVYALFFERTYYIFKECFGEIFVFELPGNTG